MAILKTLLTAATLVCAGILTILTGAAWLAPGWWLGSLLGHMRLHAGIGLAGCMIWLFVIWRWRALPLIVPVLINLSVLAPMYSTPPDLPAAADSPVIQILHYNLDVNASQHERTFAYLRDHPADVLFVQELTPALADRLVSDLPDYRVVYQHPLENTQGSALLLPRSSPLVVRTVGEVYLPASSPRPMITATLMLGDRLFTLLSMAVVRPKDAYTEDIQEHEYAAIGEWVRVQRQQTGLPIVVIGDFNSTPWADRFQRLLIAGGLRDSMVGFGYQPTWPASMPALLAIPIDHCLVSPDIRVIERAPGPDLGGDHTPLMVRIALPPASP